jgi:MFS family permease
MNWQPQKTITEAEIKTGLKYIIGDGLATEAMTVLISGTFLTAFALLLKASNLEIGLLAALPTLTNVFQLISIWLVQRYNNRRAISVVCSLLARSSLVIIGILAFFANSLTIQPIILFLFFYYFFGSVAAPSWNAWMKDLIPEKMLGIYFSRRSSYMQILNVLLSLSLALSIEYIRKNLPAYEIIVYIIMFIAAGVIGITGALVLSRAPEPQSYLQKENIFHLVKRPLKDGNFRRLLVFNSAWLFALNLAIPFYTVFMMKSLHLSLPYIIGLTILGQLFSIFTIRVWGSYTDKYSNKTIIAIGAPLYILCLVGWCFVGIYSNITYNLLLLALIHIVMGIATAGINLSLTNIGLKLAPSNEAVVYLSAKNIITAFFSSTAPLLGGYLADYFTRRSLSINVAWTSPHTNKVFHLLSLHEWNFLFLIGAGLAFIALELLVAVKETGEVDKEEVVRIMRTSIRSNLKEYFLIGTIITWQEQLWSLIRGKTTPPPDKSPD